MGGGDTQSPIVCTQQKIEVPMGFLEGTPQVECISGLFGIHLKTTCGKEGRRYIRYQHIGEFYIHVMNLSMRPGYVIKMTVSSLQ